MTPEGLSGFLKQYIGAKYTWWHEGMDIGEGAPFYSRMAGSDIPSSTEIFAYGICCAGLINVARLRCGLDGLGGTYTYESAIQWQPLSDRDHMPSVGSVLFRKYTDDEDQGHLAYMLDDTHILHSCDYSPEETGVIRSSFAEWRSYFTHIASFESVFRH